MTVKILILALCGVVALAGVGAFADDGGEKNASLEPIEVRKDDSAADAELVDDDRDDDPTGDRDKTPGDDGTNAGHNHDDDATGGDDGSAGGDNSEAAAAPAPAAGPAPAAAPAPAPAPVYDDYSDDAGYAYGGSDDGGSDG